MEIIDDLEPTKRGPYAGVVGYIDFSGNIDTAIAIRTLVVDDRGPGVGAGRCGHRGRQRSRARGPRVPQQGAGPAVGGAGCAPDDRTEARGMTQDLTHDFEASYRALRGNGGAVRLERDLVTVKGPQATDFLQGQLSQDVTAILSGRSCLSFLLQPSGKVDAWFRVGPITDGFAIDVAGGFGEAVKARLERFKLRTKVDIELVRHELGLSVGPGREDRRARRRDPRAGGRRVPARPRGRSAAGSEPRRIRGAAHRVRRAEDGRRADGEHDPGRGRPVDHRSVGELHQGLLHRTRAGGPDRLARAATCRVISAG